MNDRRWEETVLEEWTLLQSMILARREALLAEPIGPATLARVFAHGALESALWHMMERMARGGPAEVTDGR